MTSCEPTVEQDALIAAVREKVLVPFPLPEYIATVAGGGEIHKIFRIFLDNISSAVAFAGMPYTLADDFERESHFRRFYMAEKILSRAPSIRESCANRDDDNVEERVLQTAQDRLSVFLKNEMWNYVEGLMVRLRRLHLDSGYQDRLENLMRQSTVLLWTAFENFCRDIFATVLNINPALYVRIKSESVFKSELRALDFTVLELHGFDVSKTLGDILAGRRDMSDLKSIRSVYSALFQEDQDLGRALADDRLRSLSKLRNLIVHRGGYVDDIYIKSTSIELVVGERITVSPRLFTEFFDAVCHAGYCLLRASDDIRPARE